MSDNQRTPHEVVKQYTGKVDGKSQYNTIGYIDRDDKGHLTLAIDTDAYQNALDDRRRYEEENGREPSKKLYFNVFDNSRREDREQGNGFAAQEEERKSARRGRSR